MGNLTIGTKIGICLAVLTALILGGGIVALTGAGGNQADYDAIAADLSGQARELERGGTAEAARARVASAAARLENANREREAGGTWVWLAMAAGVGIALAGWFQVAQSTHHLGKLATQILDGADQVAGAASQVASASQSLAQGAAEQAASLEETSASSEELTSMTRKNSENAQNVAGLADVSQNKVEQANITLEQMVGSMNEITSSSGKISKIIKVIDEIAFQTNILALNAAVEAARAGEAGMGFAVVADEVRSLAQRCAQAAKDTASLIEESIQKSTAGGEHLSQVVSAVSSITQSSSEIKTLAQEVNLGSQEQSRGIEQISKAIVQMQSVTQRTAANAEQGAAASEEMSAQASSLKAFSQSLLAILGSDRAPAPPASGARPAASLPRPPAARAAKPTSSRSLGSLHKAVSVNKAPEVNLPLPVRNAEQEFPLDNDFREF